MAAIEKFVEQTNLVDEEEPVSKVAALFKEPSKPKHAVITTAGNYYGVIDDRAMCRFTGDAEKTKCRRIARQVPKLTRKSSVTEVISDFLNSETKVLAVVEEGKPLGVITRKAALQLMLGLKIIQGRRVEELMSTPAATVPETATIAQANAAMRSSRVYRLVVVDSRGNITGVISSYDIASSVKPHEKKKIREATFRPTEKAGVHEEPVASVMTTDVATISSQASLGEAIEKMVSRNVMALVIADNRKPAGVLSVRDVFEACVVMPPEPIVISGLYDEDAMAKTAVYDECAALLERLKKSFDVGFIAVTFKKASQTGFRHRYNIRARAFVNAHTYAVKEPEWSEHRQLWDPHLATKEVLEELEKVIYRAEKRPKKRQPFEFHRVRG